MRADCVLERSGECRLAKPAVSIYRAVDAFFQPLREAPRLRTLREAPRHLSLSCALRFHRKTALLILKVCHRKAPALRALRFALALRAGASRLRFALHSHPQALLQLLPKKAKGCNRCFPMQPVNRGLPWPTPQQRRVDAAALLLCQRVVAAASPPRRNSVAVAALFTML